MPRHINLYFVQFRRTGVFRPHIASLVVAARQPQLLTHVLFHVTCELGGKNRAHDNALVHTSCRSIRRSVTSFELGNIRTPVLPFLDQADVDGHR